jgi:hypothetical protein
VAAIFTLLSSMSVKLMLLYLHDSYYQYFQYLKNSSCSCVDFYGFFSDKTSLFAPLKLQNKNIKTMLPPTQPKLLGLVTVLPIKKIVNFSSP